LRDVAGETPAATEDLFDPLLRPGEFVFISGYSWLNQSSRYALLH
jgi:hypothetical protein